MKLTMQIAGGIFLAGLISWFFWMSVIVAAAPKLAAEASRLLPPIHVQPPTVQSPAPPPIPPRPECVNFVQMASGERHCLENAPHAEYRTERATLPPAELRSTAR